MTAHVPAEEIRKYLDDLQPADLERSPIWEFVEPDSDEDLYEDIIRARPDLAKADPTEGTFLVRVEFLASDGTKYDGYVIPQTEDRIRSISIYRGIDFIDPAFFQPTIVTERGLVGFWAGGYPKSQQYLGSAYETLGKSSEDLFPVRFKSLVDVPGFELEGEIPAFLQFASWDNRRIIEVR